MGESDTREYGQNWVGRTGHLQLLSSVVIPGTGEEPKGANVLAVTVESVACGCLSVIHREKIRVNGKLRTYRSFLPVASVISFLEQVSEEEDPHPPLALIRP